MKLRNKKTGKIIDLEFWGIFTDGDAIGFESEYEDENEYCYNSIAELNEEWEDYTPQEPLIKDEKIRKTLRAWAELNDIKDILQKVDVGRNECCSYIHDINCEMLEIGFKEKLPLGDNASYSIAELCGEKDND